MRTPVDALLSVRRYMIGVLPGPPWRILLAGDEGRVERPYAVVNTADGTTTTREGVEIVRMSLPIVVHAFPPVGARPSASKLIAERVASALNMAVSVGVADYRDTTVRGYSQKIPLWDYAPAQGLISMEELTDSSVLSGKPAVTRNRPDYMWVADGYQAQSLPQADSGELFVATLTMRVQWLVPTGLAPVGTTLQTVNAGMGRDPSSP